MYLWLDVESEMCSQCDLSSAVGGLSLCSGSVEGRGTGECFLFTPRLPKDFPTMDPANPLKSF